jgi:hypothetical protein
MGFLTWARAARPYIPYFDTGRRFARINAEKYACLDRILKICVHLRPNHLVFSFRIL